MEVLASDLTRKNFPIVDRAAELSSAEVSKLYVFSPEDILNSETQYEFEVEREWQEGKVSRADYVEFKNSYDRRAPEQLRLFLDEKYPELSGLLNDEDVRDTAIAMSQATEWNSEVNADIGGSDRATHSIILTTYADASKEFLAAGLSGLSADKFENLPGTDQQWRESGFLHELGHIDHETSSLRNELHAEIHMQEELSNLFEKAVKPEEINEFGKALRGMRAIGAFLHDGQTSIGANITHAMGAPMRIDGEGFAPRGSRDDFVNSLASAQDDVFRGVDDLMTPNLGGVKYYDIAYSMMNGQASYSHIGSINLSVEDEAVMRRILAEPDRLYLIATELSDVAQSHLYDSIKARSRNIGANISQNNPKLLYDVMREYHTNGYLPDNPIGQQYMYEYLIAARDYAPSVHDADPNDTFEPPVFDHKGQEVTFDIKGAEAQPFVP